MLDNRLDTFPEEAPVNGLTRRDLLGRLTAGAVNGSPIIRGTAHASAWVASLVGALTVAGQTTAADRTVAPTVKLLTLLHRKPGMSRQAFIDRYESIHSKLGVKYLKGYASHYVRRYMRPAGTEALSAANLPADVLMEIWFPDSAVMAACMASLMEPSAQREIVADEELMFDRSKMVSFIVDEYASLL